MRKIILATLILGLVPCLGQTQSSDYSRGHGYAYFGAEAGRGGGNDMKIHIGAGGPLLIFGATR